jgi:hypothetical protein
MEITLLYAVFLLHHDIFCPQALEGVPTSGDVARRQRPLTRSIGAT